MRGLGQCAGMALDRSGAWDNPERLVSVCELKPSDVAYVDPPDICDHEIGRVHAFGGDEAVSGECRLQLAAKKEVDPHEQDRCHAE